VESQNVFAAEGDDCTGDLPLDLSHMQEAVAKLKDLRCCEMHLTHLPTSGDEAGLRRLGVNLTSEPNFASKNLSE